MNSWPLKDIGLIRSSSTATNIFFGVKDEGSGLIADHPATVSELSKLISLASFSRIRAYQPAHFPGMIIPDFATAMRKEQLTGFSLSRILFAL